MKHFLIAPAIALTLASSVFANDPPKHLRVTTNPPAVVYATEPVCTILSKDASKGIVYVRIAADYCEATDTDVEAAAQAMYNTLTSLPEIYEYIEVVNDCELKARFSLSELETILRELEVK